jgi:hypothetical protein
MGLSAAVKLENIDALSADRGMNVSVYNHQLCTVPAIDGPQSAAVVIQEFERAKPIGSAASARLSTAEALAAGGDRMLALRMAQEALAFFESRRIWEAVWRGHAVAARVSNADEEVEQHRASSRATLDQLRNLWPAGIVESYLSREDIKLLSSRIITN